MGNKINFPLELFTTSREEFITPVELAIIDEINGTETQLPEDLRGHVFIIGPVGTVVSPKGSDNKTVLPSGDGKTALFNGDGMVYRIDLNQKGSQVSPGKAWLSTKLLKTPGYFADEITSQDRKKYRPFRYQNIGLVRLSLTLGLSGQINTALIPFRFKEEQYERLLATNDVSRPFEIDPLTLKIRSPIGSNREWKSSTIFPNSVFPQLLCSAHPCFDHITKTLFLPNTLKSIESTLGLRREERPIVRLLIRIAKFLTNLLRTQGRVIEDETYLLAWKDHQDSSNHSFEAWKVYSENKPVGIEQSTHMLGVTENHILLMDTGMKFDIFETILATWISSIFIALTIASVLSLWSTTFFASKWIDLIGWILPLFSLLIIVNAFLLYLRSSSSNKKWEEDDLVESLLALLRKFFAWPQNEKSILYVIKKNDLLQEHQSNGEKQINAAKIEIEGPITHFLTNYKEDNGSIYIHAAMTYNTDPATFITRFDDPIIPRKFMKEGFEKITNEEVEARSGMIPDGLDVCTPALIKIDLNKDKPQAEKFELPIQVSKEHTYMIGLYTYRDDRPTDSIEDIFWIGNGLWPELLTESTYQLYKNTKRRVDEHGNTTVIEDVINDILSADPKYRRMVLTRVHANYDKIESSSSTEQIIEAADSYVFPLEHIIFSVEFIPKRESTGSREGYIMCTVVRPQKPHQESKRNLETAADISHGSEFWIFDAGNLGQGPVYRLISNQLNFGMTLHSTWIETIPKENENIHYNIRKDYEDSVSKLINRQRKKENKEILHQLFEGIYQEFDDYISGP